MNRMGQAPLVKIGVKIVVASVEAKEESLPPHKKPQASEKSVLRRPLPPLPPPPPFSNQNSSQPKPENFRTLPKDLENRLINQQVDWYKFCEKQKEGLLRFWGVYKRVATGMWNNLKDGSMWSTDKFPTRVYE
jgi:hypothetical protein